MLDLLFADRKLGAASKLAFLMLWRFAGEQPGRIVITADFLAGQCGRSPKAAWLWLEELQRHDLVAIGERNERRGTVTLDVFNPCPGSRAANPDAQARLPLEAVDQPKKVPVVASEVSTPKPPRPLVPKIIQEINYQSTKEFKAPKDSLDSMRLDPLEAVTSITNPADGIFGQHYDADAKDRLKRRIMAACGRETPCTDWVVGSLANLVVYHNTPIEEVNQILCDLDAMRRAGSLRHAGKFVHAQARKLALRMGKPWPRREVVAV